MLSQFQASYQRLEASMQRLTDSIAAYNPSTIAAEELVAADDAVNENLNQLVHHQRNHVRVVELRRTAASLDETIKSTLRLLADTRKDIQAIPSSIASSGDAPRRNVRVDDLLDYAKFISKTSAPPTFRRLPTDAPPPSAESSAPHLNGEAQIANGMVTPPPGAQSHNGGADDTAAHETLGLRVMEEHDKAWLNPADLPFEPWPSQEKIQAGALADIQRMRERGEDPAAVLSAEERAVVEQEKAAAEERERREQEERMLKYDLGGARRRPTVAENVPFNPDDL